MEVVHELEYINVRRKRGLVVQQMTVAVSGVHQKYSKRQQTLQGITSVFRLARTDCMPQ